MKRPPIPRTALLALVFLLTLTIAGVPVAVHRFGDRDSGTAASLPAGAVQWTDEPSIDALAAAGTNRGRAEQFYFVLPDRFANGDSRNDRGGLSGDRSQTGFDPQDKGYYHGGDLKGW